MHNPNGGFKPTIKRFDDLDAGVGHSRRKFALLLRLAFLEGANRANTIFNKCPPSRVWVFSERITFYPANAVQKGSGTTAYAWFVWDKDAPSGTELICAMRVSPYALDPTAVCNQPDEAVYPRQAADASGGQPESVLHLMRLLHVPPPALRWWVPRDG